MAALVSAVIPNYNYGALLAGAIDSVLSQTYSPVECIVVDDGSTDDTGAVLASYDGRIRIIRQDRRGPAAARNAGIRAARGEYIALLDADDWWEPEKIAVQIRCLERRPELGAVGCRVRRLDAEGHVLDDLPPSTAHSRCQDNVRALALRRLWMGGSCSGVLARRAVFDAIGGFDEELRAAEDWDMWLRLAASFPVMNAPTRALVNIRVHRSGFARNAALVEENNWRIYEKAVRDWPEAFPLGVRRQMKALILADAAAEYVDSGDMPMAFSRYCASLQQWPVNRRRWATLAKVAVKRLLGGAARVAVTSSR
jgi:glycosyltransferase involved in cell wall biosynthesis